MIAMILIILVMLLSFIGAWTGLFEINFFILVPVLLGLILLPIQALLFDLFRANKRYLIVDELELQVVDETDKFFDAVTTKTYKLSGLEKFSNRCIVFGCLEYIALKFDNGEVLYLLSFYFRQDDFAWVKEFLMTQTVECPL